MRNPSSTVAIPVAVICYQCKALQHIDLVLFFTPSSTVADSLIGKCSKSDQIQKIRDILLLATGGCFLAVTLLLSFVYIGSRCLLLSCYLDATRQEVSYESSM